MKKALLVYLLLLPLVAAFGQGKSEIFERAERLFAEKNYAEAAKLYQKVDNYLEAQYKLGLCYDKGWGVDQDMKKAVRWYRSAATESHPMALIKLGDCYRNGAGVERDMEEAAKMYRAAALTKDPYAQWHYGYCLENGYTGVVDDLQAIIWYERAAEQGYVKAQYYAGIYYMKQSIPSFKDYVEASKWFRMAVKQGDSESRALLAEALYRIALAFYTGDEVSKDEKEAKRIFQEAAELGHVQARQLLGALF